MTAPEALVSLLAIIDEDDPQRAHHQTCAGKADRHLLIPRLSAAFIAHHQIQQDERRAYTREGK